MGRWTPLILMAGGLAILLGTLLGISFPLGGQNNASVPKSEVTPTKASKVLPANINVNSTNSGNAPANNNKSSVAQSTPADDTNNTNSTNNTDNTDNNQNKNTKDSQTNDTNESNEPVRALW